MTVKKKQKALVPQFYSIITLFTKTNNDLLTTNSICREQIAFGIDVMRIGKLG